ncbi:MAG: nickel-dependent lactate racemase [Deltaproteobacteria bacterium]|nr:nickel-dependent lactate racemase [Deltaproteobacteria bacterium]
MDGSPERTVQGLRLWYGTRGLEVRLPERCRVHVVRKNATEPLDDPAGAVRRALESPIGTAPLRDFARGGGRACVLVCDITRPVPNGLLLPAILRELEEAGVPEDRVTILIATGLHRPATEEEKRFIVGDEAVYGSVRVENHHAGDHDAHVFLGETRRGTPVLLDRRFVEAEVRIVTGLIEPHFMAGYSGGRKVVTPGIAHRDTILAIHSPGFMEHPRASSCVLDGNPLHEEQLEILRMIGPMFAVNTVVDENRRLVFVNGGDIVKSHQEAVAHAKSISEVILPRKFHTVLTSAGGFPLDKTYYQTVKGMVTALGILEPGGRIVIVSECSEGMGSASFLAAQKELRKRGPREYLRWIQRPGARTSVDQWQTEKLAQALSHGRVSLYAPGLGAGQWEYVCVDRCTDPAVAVMESVEESGDPHVAVIPEGPYVIPRTSELLGG